MVGTQGQVKWAKVAQKPSTYDVTQNESAAPEQIFFFQCRLEDLLHLLTLQPGP